MIDIDSVIKNVRFTCHACQKDSGCGRIASKRDRVDRFNPDPNEKLEIQIYCEHCGTANTLGLDDLNRTNIGSIISNFLR